MFGFPYAGGGAAVFRSWTQSLRSDIELYAVQPPGRERSFGQPPFASMSALVRAAVAEIAPLLDVPFVFFGHSLGAIVAYETALALEAAGHRPELLIVSGHRAPQLPSPRPPIAHLPDAEFLTEVTRFGGMPDEVAASTEFLELFLPVLRADFQIAEAYHATLSVRLRAPVLALGSKDDYVSEEAIAAWREVTCASFSSKIFAGGHFYIQSEREALIEFLNWTLERNDRPACGRTGFPT